MYESVDKDSSVVTERALSGGRLDTIIRIKRGTCLVFSLAFGVA